jgi:hypothetical protein
VSAVHPPDDSEVTMTTWNDLVAYVHNHYKIADENPNMIKMVFETAGMRSQVVILWHLTLADGEEWVQIESPFGELGSLDLSRALQEVGNTVCGGMAMFGNLVTFRHSLPLDNLNINEFESPLVLVTTTADNLERSLVGGDRF